MEIENGGPFLLEMTHTPVLFKKIGNYRGRAFYSLAHRL